MTTITSPQVVNNSIIVPWPGPNSPNIRSGYDILWSCLVTIFACTYTVLHLNIPSRKDSKTRRAFRKLKYLLVNLLAPEVMALAAVWDLLNARSSLKSFRKQTGCVADVWTLTHSFYALMGGFLIQTPDGEAFPALPDDLAVLIEEKLIFLPLITKEEIEERSKIDHIGKALACLQVIWFATNVITRRMEGLAITLLELLTGGYILSTLLTYGFWWSKPTDLQFATVIEISLPPIVYKRLCVGNHFSLRLEKQRIINSAMDVVSNTTKRIVLANLVAFITAFTFTLVPNLAADYPFPTTIERLAWKASSAVSGFGIGCAIFIAMILKKMYPNFNQDGLHMVGGFLYVVARLAVIGIGFSSLRALTLGEYTSINWVTALPHI